MKHVTILGAGISGLSAAWFLKQRFKDSIELTVLEKSPRVGGWIQTIRHDGFLFELGPHSFRVAGGEATLKLLEELNLQNEVTPADVNSKRRFLYTNQQLRQLPHNIRSCLFSPFTYPLISAAVHDLTTTPVHSEDESIHSFISRRFGKKIAEQFIDPLVSGIYAGDISTLSVKSCFPKWFQWERNHGSILKGIFANKQKNQELSPWIKPLKAAGIYTLRGGMSQLPTALEKQLKAHISLNCEVKQIKCQSDKIEIINSDGSIFKSDYVISTLPPKTLKLLLTENHPEISQLINIPSASVAIVCLGYKKSVLKKKGFGYLVPSKEKEDILGVIWDSSVFPEQNNYPEETRLTVMLGGTHRPEIAFLAEEKIYQMALSAIKKHLGITALPDAFYIKTAIDAIPQYNIGYTQQLEYLKEGIQNLSSRLICLGNGFEGVSINDCVANGKAAAAKGLCKNNLDD